jgi:two-component system, chemotaxis family, chemotaxis protein CheY
MEREIRVLSVGQCSFDHRTISHVLRERLGAVVQPVDTAEEAGEELERRGYSLVLINRKLDLDGSSGLTVLRELHRKHPDTPMMLVSNYEDAQQEAVRLGARPGFGKASLHEESTIELIRSTLQESAVRR